MIGRYKDAPPSSYWREVDRYDEKLFSLARHIGSFAVFRRTVDQCHAAWLPAPSEQEPHDITAVYWRGTRFGDKDETRQYSHMILGHQASGTPGEQTRVFDVYHYSARSMLKMLDVSHRVATEGGDTTGLIVNFAAPPRVVRRAGPIPIEHYDRLLTELKRGASGEAPLDLP